MDIAANISSVKQRMDDAIASNDRVNGSVRLVAVSKTKPLELLVAAYEVSVPNYYVLQAPLLNFVKSYNKSDFIFQFLFFRLVNGISERITLRS